MTEKRKGQFGVPIKVVVGILIVLAVAIAGILVVQQGKGGVLDSINALISGSDESAVYNLCEQQHSLSPETFDGSVEYKGEQRDCCEYGYDWGECPG